MGGSHEGRLKPPEAESGRREPLEGAWCCRHLDLGLGASGLCEDTLLPEAPGDANLAPSPGHTHTWPSPASWSLSLLGGQQGRGSSQATHPLPRKAGPPLPLLWPGLPGPTEASRGLAWSPGRSAVAAPLPGAPIGQAVALMGLMIR